ncbi:MAG TPA: hypothetical protein VGL97_17580 [Bryobacteraceae bacterium]
MRITVSHNKRKEDVIQSVDRFFDEIFQSVGLVPLQIVNEQRSWAGPTLTFSFTAKMGVLSTPVKGTVEVSDKDVTIDADLGLLEKLIGGTRRRTSLENKIRGLLT